MAARIIRLPQPAPRIGPNAVIQLAQVLVERMGDEPARCLLCQGGFPDALDAPPAAMLEAERVSALFATTAACLGPSILAVAAEAGRRVGEYVLANRIPGFARLTLRTLPRRLATRLLLAAIARNAWTFGAESITTRPGPTCEIRLIGDPIGLPGAPWHAAVIATLFRRLVARTTEIAVTRDGQAWRFTLALA